MSNSDESSAARPNDLDASGLEARREVLGRIEEIFWIYDPAETCFIYVGAGFAMVWGRDRAPLYEDAEGYFEAIHPEDRERVRRAFCSDGTGTYDEIFRVRLPDGGTRWVRDRAFPLLEEGERFPYVAGLASDLTELLDNGPPEVNDTRPFDRRSTIKLDRSDKRYRRLFLESADACVLFDLQGYIIEANQPATELLGRGPHQMARTHFTSFCPSDTLKAAVQYWEEVTRGQPQRFTLPVIDADGAQVLVEVAATLINFGPEYVVQATVRGVTPRAEMARELEVARDQLAQAQKMELVGQLAGGIAHDFNNLLSVILSCAQFVDQGLDGNPRLRGDIQQIVEASESAAALVRRLMTFARHDVPSAELVDPQTLLESIAPLLERALPKSISLEYRIDENLSSIYLSRVEFEQVIMNLGLNARDAMPQGGKLVIELEDVDNTQVPAGTPMKDEVDRFVRMCVRDTGVGMDEQTRSRIFEPFFTTKPTSKGTGLGLSTVLNLVEQNRGFIRVASRPGAGSTFEIFFPQARPSEAQPHDRNTTAPPPPGNETVLVVDDDREVRQLVRRILQTEGYTAMCVDGAKQALDLLSRHTDIDLLLTDIALPDCDGPSLVEHARRLRPDLVVLYTSGYIDDARTRTALREHDAHFLPKPITPPSLLSKVREVLASATTSALQV